MICPNCGSNMSDKRKLCERCGTDLTLSRKILKASNLYYNNGLARAKVRDLSGAIIALRNSLELNKSNTNARNLLGLIYFEMGETVAALSEWVISKHLKVEDNDADEYINKVQSNPTRLDSLNQAIKRYNTALTYAKQNSADLAVIQLKKVISLNPHFIRAYHLLALLYMKSNENDKARRILMKAIKIDVSNTTSLRYLRELEVPVDKDLDSNPEAEKSPTSSIMPISSYKEEKPSAMIFVNLVIGIIIGVALTSFLIIPTIKKNNVLNNNSNYVDYGEGLAKIEEKEATINALQQDKEALQKKVDELNKELDGIVIPEVNKALYDPLFDSVDIYINEIAKTRDKRDFTVLADLLFSIDESKYESETSVALLTRMRTEVYPLVTDIYYTEGRRLYNNGKYDEALVQLKKAIDFNPENVDAIYFLGRTYHRLQDFDNAALYYNIVITDYPDSQRTNDAKSFLREVQG